MADVRFEATHGALRMIANSGELAGVCLRGAESVARQARGMAPASYLVDVRPGMFRVHARCTAIVPTDRKDRIAYFRVRPLTRAKPHI